MSRPARILYVTAAGERGGAEGVLLTVLGRIDRARFEPIVVSLREGPFVAEIERRAGLPVTVFPAARFRDAARAVSLVSRLRRLLREREVQLVHSNGTGAHLYAGLAAWLSGTPSVYHTHDLVERAWSRQFAVQRIALSVPATVIVAVSRYAADSLRAAGARRPVRVVHNGVDVGALADDAVGSATTGAAEQAAPLVVWCGRLQRWKGAHVFVRAAASVSVRLPRARFAVVGGPAFGLEAGFADELRRLRDELNLGSRLEFTGHLPDPQPMLSAAAIVVHSSIRAEPFPLSILEAMALGKAVIASGVGGVLESVEGGVSGLLVPPGDPDALAGAIARLLEDEPLRRRLGSAARRRVVEEFSADAAVRRVETLYEELLAAVT